METAPEDPAEETRPERPDSVARLARKLELTRSEHAQLREKLHRVNYRLVFIGVLVIGMVLDALIARLLAMGVKIPSW